MRRVKRDEIVDYQTYEETRAEFRAQVMKIKDRRRIHLGKHLTFLFENHDTIRYQVQEMMRAEQIVKEADINHEIETYNELLGKPGEIGCTLLIEIETEAERAELLKKWLPLVKHLYVRLADGNKSYASFDPRQVGDERLSSVQYLAFEVGDQAPVSIGCDFELMTLEAELTDDQRKALGEDIAA